MSAFKVGDVAIVLPSPEPVAESHAYLERYNGQEVTIVSGPIAQQPNMKYPFGPLWIIKSSDGVEWYCAEGLLQKKRPPARECDQKVAWSDCHWRPRKALSTVGICRQALRRLGETLP